MTSLHELFLNNNRYRISVYLSVLYTHRNHQWRAMNLIVYSPLVEKMVRVGT
jgi:hypothetical protein